MTVEAKPQDIPGEVEVDVSELAIGDQLRVSDLPLPPGVISTLDPETLVVQVVGSARRRGRGRRQRSRARKASRARPRPRHREGGESEGGEE